MAWPILLSVHYIVIVMKQHFVYFCWYMAQKTTVDVLPDRCIRHLNKVVDQLKKIEYESPDDVVAIDAVRVGQLKSAGNESAH